VTPRTLAGAAAPAYAAAKPAIDEAKWLDRLRQLQPIRFCPIVPGEAAPYPSCTAKG
jgi:hypothetical protein